MGQKSNPIALRTRQKGRFFDSSWYNDMDYAKAISRDQMIEKYLGSVTKNMKNQNSRFYIQELSKKYILTLFYFKAQETRQKRSKPLSLRKTRSKTNLPKIGYYINTMGCFATKSTNGGALTNPRKTLGLLAKKNIGINAKKTYPNKSMNPNGLQTFGGGVGNRRNSKRVRTGFYKNKWNKYSAYLTLKKTHKLNITNIAKRGFNFTPILQNFGVFLSRKSLFNIYENQSLDATGTVIGGSSRKQLLKNNQNIANFFYQRLEKNNKSSMHSYNPYIMGQFDVPQSIISIAAASNKSEIYEQNRRLVASSYKSKRPSNCSEISPCCAAKSQICDGNKLAIYKPTPLYIDYKRGLYIGLVKDTIKKNTAQRSKMGNGISLPTLQSCFIKKYNNQYSILHNYYNDGLRGPFTHLLTTINTKSRISQVQKPRLKQEYQPIKSFGVFQAFLSSKNKARYHQMIKTPSYLYINKMGEEEHLRNKKLCEIVGGYAPPTLNPHHLYNHPGIKYPTNSGHYLYTHYAQLYTNYKLYQGYKYKQFDIGIKKKRRDFLTYAAKPHFSWGTNISSGKKYLYNKKFANQTQIVLMRKMFAKTYFKDLVEKKYKHHISNTLSHMVKSNVVLRVRHLKSDYLSANSLAEEIAYYMKRGSRFGQIKNRIVQELDQGLITRKIIGMRISCSGRIGGRSKKALRSRTLGLRNGSVPLNNFTRKIDYCYKKARTRYGIVGIKIWLSYR